MRFVSLHSLLLAAPPCRVISEELLKASNFSLSAGYILAGAHKPHTYSINSASPIPAFQENLLLNLLLITPKPTESHPTGQEGHLPVTTAQWAGEHC